MSTVQSAHNAMVDGMVRSGRSMGMTVEQLRSAGQVMLGQLREAQAANPLLAEYFPGLGQWAAALSGRIEQALTDLTREVPREVDARIDAAYRGVVGNDRQGRPIDVGPLLRDELIGLIDGGASDADLRAHVLASQEVGDARRAMVEGAYATVLGRGSGLAEREALARDIDRRLAQGASLGVIEGEITARTQALPEKQLLERVGNVAWSVFPEHDAPSLETKRHWTNWVQAAMARGMTEDMALVALSQQLQSGS